MEKKELTEALELHGKQISDKQAELQKAIEDKLELKAAEIKAEVDKLEGLRAEMQKQLNDLDLEIQKQKHDPRGEVKTFAQELKAELDKEAQKISGLKSGAINELKLQIKSFLETANASVTTGSLLPQYQFDPGISKAPDRMPFMMDIVTTAIANSLTVFWTQRKTRTDNSEWVAEGVAPANQTVLGYETKTATMQNLGDFIKVSNNSLDDITWLLSEIQTELMTLIVLKVDAALLTGTVGANGFDGVLTKATAFSAAGKTLAAGVKPTRYDALKFAATQIKKAHHRPNYVILNPDDVLLMELERDDNGGYLFPPYLNATPQFAGVRIIENTGIASGTYLIGDFSKAKFWVRKSVEIKIWEQNDTDPVDQLKTITGYMRGTLVIKDADTTAFVTDTFADTTAEITAV